MFPHFEAGFHQTSFSDMGARSSLGADISRIADPAAE
jgi:hypothetical protein